jgi:hypothetical protein
MSRTFRKDMLNLDLNDRSYSPHKVKFWYSEGYYLESHHHDYYSKRNRKFDGKSWHKSPKWYKKMKSRIRKAKVKDSMVKGKYDIIPVFHRENDWNWN